MKEKTVTLSTKICAVMGKPIGHSMSPAIHNAALDLLNLDYVYVAFEVDDVKSVLTGMRALDNFRGLSVTIPHKMEVIKYIDEINDIDRSIGSINTIINENGKLIGVGTDGPGALKALVDAGVELRGKCVAMVGAGGVARAIAFTLIQEAGVCKISLLDVDEQMLQGLERDLKSGTSAEIESFVSNPASIANVMEYADVIVNCTPIGMHPREGVSVIPADLFRDGQAVFDVVYNPIETKLICDAKSRGLIAVSGVEMFINQAAMQFEYFTGVTAPVEEMRRVLMEKLGL
ncbi:MAG: shikimate dehydrogenase [Desulfuromonadaceae bacterium]|nr:shikimate dehydrogenase [Desulfuromonadaceae bacterium]